MKNIILIGMPGAGKSTIGVILAKTLGVDFIDTDIVIQNRTGELLHKTLARVGVKGLLDEEEKAITELDLSKRCVGCDRRKRRLKRAFNGTFERERRMRILVFAVQCNIPTCKQPRHSRNSCRKSRNLERHLQFPCAVL